MHLEREFSQVDDFKAARLADCVVGDGAKVQAVCRGDCIVAEHGSC